MTSLLDVEIVVRIAADWRRFHRKPRILVDLGLALATTIIILPPIRNLGQTYAWLTIFQILRIYRVVLAVPITRSLIRLVLGNAAGIGNLVLFVFLMTFFVSIFASQLFRGQIAVMNANGSYNQVTFATIYNSFLGMYQLLSSENWTAVLYNVTASTTGSKTAWIGATFLIGWFILAFFLLVNMFIAVIQENFDVSEDTKRMEQVKAFLQRKELGTSSGNLALSTIFSLGRDRKRRDPLDYGPATLEMLLKEAVVQEFLDEAMEPPLQQAQTDGQTPTGGGGVNAGGAASPGLASTLWGKLVSLSGNTEPNPFHSSNVRFNMPGENFDPRRMAREAVNATAMRRKAQRAYL
ncbi:MAG: ion transporter, partial [Thaumarchaeota archaeon]|nr:ion transporter [Nitrososphaerota archaeon]